MSFITKVSFMLFSITQLFVNNKKRNFVNEWVVFGFVGGRS